MRNEPAPARVHTIGHSNHDWPRFLRLLQAAGVAVVADVRSQPYSRRLPQYNGPDLAQGLQQAGIAYVFLGDLLGGRPADPDLYDAEGRVDYERVRKTGAFRHGIERLVRALRQGPVALLCSEADPLDCHRALMIGPALAEEGLEAGHIRSDGSVETTAELEARLLAVTGVGDGLLDGLFAASLDDGERQQLLGQAYRERARRVAFRNPNAQEDASISPEERSRYDRS
jgi:uncharacterized protein (DUF488 family)